MKKILRVGNLFLFLMLVHRTVRKHGRYVNDSNTLSFVNSTFQISALLLLLFLLYLLYSYHFDYMRQKSRRNEFDDNIKL